ncbi:MAG: hypothetical protein J7K40_09435 [candidate division Zixibacteria bacterium]|nr:hypothetical protein [candidate division Zixibacteria bacterium]
MGYIENMQRQQALDKRMQRRDVERKERRLSRSEQRAAERQAEQATVAGGQQVAAAGRMEGMYKKLLGGIGDTTATATASARGDLAPWRKAGVDALGQLQTKIAAGPGEFEESPGYQFRLAEGQKAIERGAAARGGALSGAAMKAGMRYGQDFATKDYDNFLRRYYESMSPLERMSGQGMEAARGMGEFTLSGAGQADDARFRATQGMAGAAQYGGESLAGGTMNAANIMAAQSAGKTQRDVAYNAWKLGESTRDRREGMWGFT